MASCKGLSCVTVFPFRGAQKTAADKVFTFTTAKLPKPEPGDDSAQLPQTLVRIPTEHAPTLQAQADAAAEENQESP